MSKCIATALAAPVVLAAFSLGGCFSANSTRSFTGQAVGESSLKQIKVGETTCQRLVATLGAPTGIEKVPGAAIYRYEGVEQIQNRSRTAFIGSAKETIKRRHTHYFEIQNGLVSKHWSDSVCLHKDSDLNSP